MERMIEIGAYVYVAARGGVMGGGALLFFFLYCSFLSVQTIFVSIDRPQFLPPPRKQNKTLAGWILRSCIH